MIIPDIERMTDESCAGPILQWLKTLSQEQLMELHSINQEWWIGTKSTTKRTNPVGKVMADWIEENNGVRNWWVAVELKEKS